MIRLHTKKNLQRFLMAIAFIGVVGGLVGALSLAGKTANAADIDGWQAGRIIDDNVFTNKNSMSVSQIQLFLNSKVPDCDTNGTQTSEFGGGTRAQYGAAHDNPPPFICLKDYTEGGRSAAQIIYDTGQEFSINPQVLIVLLQKEQSLVTDTWPLNVQYKTATGYGCPDTAPCDAQYFGLTNQLRWSGRMFRAIMDASPTWYTPYVMGNNYIQYNPTASCGGTTVNIQNRATQALYNYTPYQPNPGALAAGWGQATCGAYGNRNFYLYFKSWFGNTLGPDQSATLQYLQGYADQALTTKLPMSGDTYVVQPGQDIYLQVRLLNDGRSYWTDDTKLGTSGPIERDSVFYENSWDSTHRLAELATAQGIGPYGTSTVTVKLRAPTTKFLYEERLDVVQEGVIWFNKGFTLKVQVSDETTEERPAADYSLLSGQTITAGESRTSVDGYSHLSLNESGTVELYVNFVKVWNSPNAGQNARLAMQQDGNLVLYTSAGVAVWNSETGGNAGSNAYLQADGNLVIYRPNGQYIWQSNTSTGISHTLFPTSDLYSGGVMFKNQVVESYDRNQALHFQGDGNLVLYDKQAHVALWSSNTFNLPAHHVAMQLDGNLVIYDASNEALWNSGTGGKGASKLVAQNDGNAVIYNTSALYSWASHTAR